MRSLTIPFVLCTFLVAPALAVDATKTGKEAFGSWKDDAPGTIRKIMPSDLPAAQEQEDQTNPAAVVARPDHVQPKLPPGFQAELIARDIESPRAMRIAPNGDLFVADSMANQIRIYRFDDNGRVADSGIFIEGLNQPYGIAFYPPNDKPTYVYIANTDSVVRVPYKEGELKTTAKPEVIVDKIPSTHHWTRDIVFAPDGKRFYLSVGSGSNIALDMSPQPMGGKDAASWDKENGLGATWDTEEGRADVLTYDPDGKNRKIYATGLRNCAGLTLNPDTEKPWCVVNERDGLGPNTPFEYATEVKDGAFYGWPWFYIGQHEDTRTTSKRPDLADKVTVPDVVMQAHSAPLGIAFYEGSMFPAEMKGSAFVTMHGSWNRGGRTGYKVVRLPFENGKPTGAYIDFMTGFVLGEEEVWGRPVGVAVAKDGSLLVSEDGNGTIWRVTYKAP
ncbi:PQQ-dependent sugar dehydrogenase [Aestuariivirga sp.]|uniref:PQQ-dependent sugar dehydrogenase n=1 Tax=Aestuariivirga sp. TaxID=2650926 RepID=UPI0039E48604